MENGEPVSRGFPISCNQKMTQPELPSSLYLLGQSGDAATVKRLRSDHDFILMKPVMTTSSQSLDVFSSTTISIYHAVHDSATSKSGKNRKMSGNVEMATKNRPWNHTHHRRVAAYEYANRSPQAVGPRLAHGRLESYSKPHHPILFDRSIGHPLWSSTVLLSTPGAVNTDMTMNGFLMIASPLLYSSAIYRIINRAANDLQS